MPTVELARNFPRELLQIEGVFRLEGLFTFAQEVEPFRGLLEEKRIDHGTVEVGSRRRRMALVRLVKHQIRTFLQAFGKGQTHREGNGMIGIGFFDNAVSQTSRILVHLVGLGPGHHDHRDGSLGTDGFDVLLEILLEERNTLFGDGFARHALQENNVEHLRRIGLHVGIHLVRGEIVLDVVEAQHTSTDSLQACLPGSLSGSRQTANIAVDAAVVKRIGIADIERGLGIVDAERRHLGRHGCFQGLGAGRHGQRGAHRKQELFQLSLLEWACSRTPHAWVTSRYRMRLITTTAATAN